MPPRSILPALVCALLALPAAAEPGGIWQTWGLLFGEVESGRPAPELRFEGDAPVDGSRLELRDDSRRFGALAGLGGELEPTPGVLIFAGVDTGLVPIAPLTDPTPTRTFADEARETWLIRALGVELFADDGRRWSVLLGKQRLTIGGGLLVDTPALGADVAFDDALFGLRFGLWWPGRRAVPRGWPIVRAVAEWRPDLFVQVRLFGASTRFDGAQGRALVEPAVFTGLLQTARRLRDALPPAWFADDDPPPDPAPDDEGDDPLDDVLDCVDYAAEVTPWWVGLEAEALLDGHTLLATAVVGGGATRIALDIADTCPRIADLAERIVPPRRFGLLAAGLDARWRMRLAEQLYLGAFAVAASGDDVSQGFADIEDFTALMAPAPLLDRPSLILDGGLGADLGERPARIYGYSARGVLGGGPTALLVPHPAFEIDLLAAPMWAGAGAGARFYGWEADGAVRWQPFEPLIVRARGAVLWPGGFFPGGGPWWRVALTVEGLLP